MSLKPLQTHITADASLYAPYTASGGGGGGGPNPVVSTITLPDGTLSGDGAIFSLGNQSTLSLSSDGATFPGLSPTLIVALNEGDPAVVAVGANLIAGGIGLIGQAGQYSSQTPAFINGNGTGSVMVSSILVSSINGAAPGAAVIPGDLSLSTLTMGIPGGITAISSLASVGGVLPVIGGVSVSSIFVSTINGAAYIPASLKMDTGVTTLDAGGSTIIETDKIFLVTDPVPQVTYRGAVGPGVSSLGAEALSPSTFIVYGAPNTNINWFAAGN